MLGIEHLFDIIIGYDDVVNSKPHPEGMLRIIEHYQANPKKILFLGDTIYDYEVARNSGVASGLIGWSLRKFPSDVQPDIWLNDYRDLVEVVKYGTKKI
jgi:pyrophosphatase PpaX